LNFLRETGPLAGPSLGSFLRERAEKVHEVRKKKPASNRKKAVLDGYKKVGSVFIPPIVHRIGSLDYVSWASHTLPELIWWDVLIDRVSNRFAAKVGEEIGKYFKGARGDRRWWAFISDYSHLGADDINRLKEHLSNARVLDEFLEGLVDFLNLYPECPISKLLATRPTGIVDTSYLSRFESRMNGLEIKRSRNAVLVQAQAVYMAFVSGKFRVARGMALADFPEVERYPTTERSKQVGAAVCATVNMFVGTGLPKYQDDAWVQYFWQRSLELRPLNFAQLENK
jgi:hypothetical protein